MKLSEAEIKEKFRSLGQPRKYHFETLEVNEVTFIPCRASDRDRKLASIRTTVNNIKKKSGMTFKTRMTDTGVEVVRTV